MANELDQTIEELEAEVLKELEEANGSAPLKKGAAPAEPMKKIDADEGEIEDLGDEPEKAAAKSKEVKDQVTKGEGKPEPMQKIKEGMHGKKEGMHEKMTKRQMITAMKDMMKNMPEADHEQMENIYAGYHEMAHPDKDMKDTSDMSNEDMHKEMMSGADKMVKSKVEKLHAAYQEAMHGEEDDADDEMMEAHIRSIDVSDHVNALMSGEGDLSEEFKLKAATVFEAAVKAKVREELTRIQEDYNDELEETVQTHKDSLVEKVDDYLNYAVDEWINENELAIERGLKGEIAEDFIGGLRQLFEDHYVDVPDEKYDVLESQSQRIDELEEKLNEALNANISVKKENNELQRKEVISSLSEDLTYTEIEKFKSLVEDVEFDDKDTYTTKLETLKESYFPNNVQEVFESVDNVDAGPAQDIDVSDSMQAYLTALSKTAKGANN